jgi:hypothetical protein
MYSPKSTSAAVTTCRGSQSLRAFLGAMALLRTLCQRYASFTLPGGVLCRCGPQHHGQQASRKVMCSDKVRARLLEMLIQQQMDVMKVQTARVSRLSPARNCAGLDTTAAASVDDSSSNNDENPCAILRRSIVDECDCRFTGLHCCYAGDTAQSKLIERV